MSLGGILQSGVENCNLARVLLNNLERIWPLILECFVDFQEPDLGFARVVTGRVKGLNFLDVVA